DWGHTPSQTHQSANLKQISRHQVTVPDLFCADRKLILRALKSLMQGDDAVIVILSGTEELSNVIRSDPQVQRRFTSMVLPELSEQADTVQNPKPLRTLISQLCAPNLNRIGRL
uniref:TniB family NTP-binding protein n=1 Tax=Celeribacter halophilus TaxID=576117 RepID=UPI003A8FCD6F